MYNGGMTKLSAVLLKAVKANGFGDAKSCAEAKGFGYSLFRKVLGEGHIPRDEQLLVYADGLGISRRTLIRLAHYERTPLKARPYLEDLASGETLQSLDKEVRDKISKEDTLVVERLLEILESDNRVAINGVKASVEAFYCLANK